MLRALAAATVLFATSAPAQVTSYKSSNAATIKGDADKVVCQREERLGTRLGAKKVCLTVSEWRAREDADREQTEGIQAGVRTRCAEPCLQDSTLGKVF